MTEVITTRPCPTCKGKKRGMAHMNYGDGRPHEWKEIDCFVCSGTGEIDHAHITRIRQGRRLRDQRIQRDVSLYEEAKRLGIKVTELSAMEQGFREIPAAMMPEPVTDGRFVRSEI